MRRYEPRGQAPAVFVARQAIFDRQREVAGYELLYRRSETPTEHEPVQQGSATALMVCEAAFAIGFDKLCDNKLTFINADRQFLLDGAPEIQPAAVVFQVGEDVDDDEAMVESCRRLKAQGFRLVLDDARSEQVPGLREIADFLKVSFPRSDAGRCAAAVRHAGRAVPIATHIETPEAFGRAYSLGYRYFQGFFFGQPVIKEGRVMAPDQMNRLRLLQALQDPRMTVDQLDALIKPDPALCYRILRTVNSAAFARRTSPKSIREALLLIGHDSVRRWASLWALTGSTAPGQSELLALSVIRARVCEVLAGSTGDPELAATGFLVGICSLLDVILARPMAGVMEDLGLDANVCAALMGEANTLRGVLDCVIAYTSGRWEASSELAATLGLDFGVLPGAYSDALRWNRQLHQAA